MSSLKERIELGLVTPKQVELTENLFGKMKIWILVTSDDDKAIILRDTQRVTFFDRMQVLSTVDMKRELGLL